MSLVASVSGVDQFRGLFKDHHFVKSEENQGLINLQTKATEGGSKPLVSQSFG